MNKKKKSVVVRDMIDEIKASGERKHLIGGRLVFVSMSATTLPPDGFVSQRQRDAVGMWKASFQRRVAKLYVYVHPALFEFSKYRFALSIDAYLQWGLKQSKGLVAIIGGVEVADSHTHVNVLVFESGKLVGVYDQELPYHENITFMAAAESIISKIRTDYPGVVIKQFPPLSNWGIEGVEYLGEKGERVLKNVTYKPLSKSIKNHSDYLLPGGVVLAGMLINFGLVGSSWNAFEKAQATFDAAVADPEVRAAGGVNSEYLNVITQRRIWMETPRRQDVLPSKVLQIVRGVAMVPGVQIIELQLPASSISGAIPNAVVVSPDGKQNNDLITVDRVADAKMTISVPKTTETSLDQARSLLMTIAGSTGMSLRLMQNGYKDEEGSKRRIYTIEGFLHG